MHWPCIHGLAALAGVQLRATEMEFSCCPVDSRGSGGLQFFYIIHISTVQSLLSSLCHHNRNTGVKYAVSVLLKIVNYWKVIN